MAGSSRVRSTKVGPAGDGSDELGGGGLTALEGQPSSGTEAANCPASTTNMRTPKFHTHIATQVNSAATTGEINGSHRGVLRTLALLRMYRLGK